MHLTQTKISDNLANFWDWCKRTFTPAYKAEIEAYLAESADLCDLERRMAALMRRGML